MKWQFPAREEEKHRFLLKALKAIRNVENVCVVPGEVPANQFRFSILPFDSVEYIRFGLFVRIRFTQHDSQLQQRVCGGTRSEFSTKFPIPTWTDSETYIFRENIAKV